MRSPNGDAWFWAVEWRVQPDRKRGCGFDRLPAVDAGRRPALRGRCRGPPVQIASRRAAGPRRTWTAAPAGTSAETTARASPAGPLQPSGRLAALVTRPAGSA